MPNKQLHIREIRTGANGEPLRVILSNGAELAYIRRITYHEELDAVPIVTLEAQVLRDKSDV